MFSRNCWAACAASPPPARAPRARLPSGWATRSRRSTRRRCVVRPERGFKCLLSFQTTPYWSFPSQARGRFAALCCATVREHATCSVCGGASWCEVEQALRTVDVCALRAAARGGALSFEACLAELWPHARVGEPPCGCSGARLSLSHSLNETPRVYIVSLAWGDEAASKEEIADVIRIVGTTLHLRRAFASQPAAGASDDAAYNLCAVVCRHDGGSSPRHTAFVLSPAPATSPASSSSKSSSWARFDDEVTQRPSRIVGGVGDACVQRRLRPEALFYCRANDEH